MKSRWKKMLFFSGMVVGLLAVFMIRSMNQQNGALEGARLDEVLLEQSKLIQEIQSLKDEAAELKARVEALMLSDREPLDLLKEELTTHHMLLGVLSVEGPGIELILEDGALDPSLESDAIDNWFKIIHNNDMLRVLNELLMSGAQSIEINGERLTAQSEVYCSWAFISINGRKLPAPYRIRVVGDQEKLLHHTNSTDTHLFLMRHRGIQISVEAMERLRLEGSIPPWIPQYLHPKE